MTLASDHNAKGLVEHLEHTLGPVTYGWSVDPDGAKMPFQIVRFTRGSDPESVGYSTLGLSRKALPSPNSQQLIRQELLILAPESLTPDHIASVLHQVGEMAMGTGRALVRGDVIGPAGPLVSGATVTALYVTTPSYFPEGFAVFDAGEHGKVVVAWLVPITNREADFVAQHGWDAFEDELVEQNPDLVDFHRSAMTL